MARTFALIYFIMVQLVKSVLLTVTRGYGRLNIFRFQQLAGVLLVAVWGLVSACSPTTPAREFDIQAIQLSLLRTQVAGHGFIHTVYENGKPPEANGGCIATLLAPRLSKVDRVVTIAANLDILAWTEFFGYLPLIDSINPADLPALEPAIRQLHLTGSRDRNVPPQTIERFRNVQSTAEFIAYENFDHICCWESEWPALAARFAEGLD